MSSLLTKVLGDKKEWRSMEARADALPRDYRIVYAEIKPYLFRFASGDGMDITGEDVAAFCDKRLRDTPSYTDKWRASLNRDVADKLGHTGPQG
jgi:DNA-binding ferritin-like protein (Dps family)